MTELVDQFRARCLAYPETSERSSWGHPNFCAGKKTFTTFEVVQGKPSFAFRIDPGDAALLLQGHQNLFTTPYGQGKWISMWAEGPIDWAFVDKLIDDAYHLVALKRMLSAHAADCRGRS